MGFYGNITNIARAAFQFDKVYPNRYEMVYNAGVDNVYPGRYVLVSYETQEETPSYIDTLYGFNDGSGIKLYEALLTCGGNSTSAMVDQVTDDSTEKSATGNDNSKEIILNTENEYANKYVTGVTDQNATALNAIFVGGVKALLIDPANYTDKIITFAPKRNITVENPTDTLYFKVTAVDNTATKNKYSYISATEDNFLTFCASQDNDFISDTDTDDAKKDKYEYYYHAHLVNSELLTDGRDLKVGDIVAIPPGFEYTTNLVQEFWQVIGDASGNYLWSMVTDEQENLYTKNFNIDKKWFKANRGYDSTVWQKVYADGIEQYILIAELNTVIPTFDVRADAPTLVPMPPHFDPLSTNVYYRLHQQPTWGLRVKAASNIIRTQKISETGSIGENVEVDIRDKTLDNVYYPSDASVTWKNKFYDVKEDEESVKYFNPTTGKWVDESSDDTDIPAAIYFNDAGFSPTTINYSNDIIEKYESNYKKFNKDIADSGWEVKNEIKLEPSGISGKVYSDHAQDPQENPADDTYELSIMLPKLGDSIAQIWDMVYGGRDTNSSIKKSNQRNQDVSWLSGNTIQERTGLRLVSDGVGLTYNEKEAETLAGCINSAHDILGMIITPLNQSDVAYEPTKLTKQEFDDYNEDEKPYLYVKSEVPGNSAYTSVSEYTEAQIEELYKLYGETETDEGDSADTSDESDTSVDTETIDEKIYYTFYRGIRYAHEIALTDQDSKKYDENKIYYNNVTQAYYRKHETYDYEKIKYTYILLKDINEDNYVKHLFYIKDVDSEDGYSAAPNDFDSSLEYYARVVADTTDIYTPVNAVQNDDGTYELDENGDYMIEGNIEAFDYSKYWYCDYTKLDNKLSEDPPFKDNFIKDTVFHADRNYYTVTAEKYTLSDSYKKGTYYYKENGNYWIDFSEKPFQTKVSSLQDEETGKYIETEITDYYNIYRDNVVKVSSGSATQGYGGIYIPNAYYCAWPTYDADGNEVEGEAVFELAIEDSINSYVYPDTYTLKGSQKYYPKKYTTADGQVVDTWTNTYAGKRMSFYRLTEHDTEGERATFFKTVSWIPIDSNNYQANKYYYEYYVDDSGTEVIVPNQSSAAHTEQACEYKISSAAVAKEGVTYYRKTQIYTPILDESFTIDQSKSYDLVQFKEDTFYKEIYNEKNEFVGYQLATVENLMEDMMNYVNGNYNGVFPDYFAFGRDVVTDGSSTTGYTYWDADGKPIINSIDGDDTVKICMKQESFYVPNMYHYLIKDGGSASGKYVGSNYNGSYIFATDSEYDDSREYYKITKIEQYDLTATELYIPDEYYTYDEETDQYILATDPDPEEDVIYYEKEDIYVLSDDSYILSKGALWNDAATFIPPGLELAHRTTRYELIPLEGFARNVNTMHGLIVKINQMLESSDELTRDNDNVQGVINQMNDIIARFGNMTPNQLTIVDAYGRVRSTAITTQQDTSLKIKEERATDEPDSGYNHRMRYGVFADEYQPVVEGKDTDGNAIYGTTNDMEHQWITANINGTAYKPEIHIHHNFQRVPDTTSLADKNVPLTVDGEKKEPEFQNIKTQKEFPALARTQDLYTEINNNSQGDSLNLYTPIVDAMGHVVGHNAETVTLPYGFKSITVTNTQDEDEQWAQDGESTQSEYENDATIVADNTQDTLNLKAGNKWVRFQTDATDGNLDTYSNSEPEGDNTLTIAHETHDIDVTPRYTNLNDDDVINQLQNTDDAVLSDVDNDNITFQDLDFDIAGHVIKNELHTYTLPYGFRTITTDGLSKETTDGYTTITPQSGTTAATSSATTGGVLNTTVADQTQDTLVINPGNKWLQINIEDIDDDDENHPTDTITLYHETHAIDEVAQYSNLNNNSGSKIESFNYADEVISTVLGDNITIQDLSFDNAGHVTQNKKHTYTLPYGFKFLKTAAISTENGDIYTNITAETTDASSGDITKAETSSLKTITTSEKKTTADNTQDTLSINPANKWIQIKMTDSTDDTISIAHEIHAIDRVTQFTNKNTDSLAAQSDADKITVQDLAFDAAGHVTQNREHTYVLPFGFKNLKVTNNQADGSKWSQAVGKTQSVDENATDIIADNTQDTLNLATGNKWIRLQTDSTNDILTFAHETHDVTPDTSTATLSSEDSAVVTFDVPTYTFDIAGHYNGLNTKTITMPYGYGKFKGDEGDTSAASATYDTFDINGDTWIKTTTETDKISISHKAPAAVTVDATTGTPNFGETFVIPTLHFDDTGHKDGESTYTITLPIGSYTADTVNGNVLTSMALVPSTGAISTTSSMLGDLTLGSYTAPDTLPSTITATASLSQALMILDKEISTLDTNKYDSDTTFVYIEKVEGKDAVYDEITGAVITPAVTPVAEVDYTVQQLATKLRELELRIEALE